MHVSCCTFVLLWMRVSRETENLGFFGGGNPDSRARKPWSANCELKHCNFEVESAEFTVCTSRFSPSLIHGLCAFCASSSRFMRLFQAALDTPPYSPFTATLSVHGLHFTVYALSTDFFRIYVQKLPAAILRVAPIRGKEGGTISKIGGMWWRLCLHVPEFVLCESKPHLRMLSCSVFLAEASQPYCDSTWVSQPIQRPFFLGGGGINSEGQDWIFQAR